MDEHDLARDTLTRLIPPDPLGDALYKEAATVYFMEWWQDVERRPAEYTRFLNEMSNRYAPDHAAAIRGWWECQVSAVGLPPDEQAAINAQADRLFKELEAQHGQFDFDDIFKLFDFTYPELARRYEAEIQRIAELMESAATGG